MQGGPQLVVQNSAQLQKEKAMNKPTQFGNNEPPQQQQRRNFQSAMNSQPKGTVQAALSSQKRTLDGNVSKPQQIYSHPNEYYSQHHVQQQPMFHGQSLQSKVFSFANAQVANGTGAAQGYVFVPSIVGATSEAPLRGHDQHQNGPQLVNYEWSSVMMADVNGQIPAPSQLVRHSSKKRTQLSIGGPTINSNPLMTDASSSNVQGRGQSQRTVPTKMFSANIVHKQDLHQAGHMFTNASNENGSNNSPLIPPRIQSSLATEKATALVGPSSAQKAPQFDVESLLLQMKAGNPQRHIFQFSNVGLNNIPQNQQVQVVVGNSQQAQYRPDQVKWNLNNSKTASATEARRQENDYKFSASGSYNINQQQRQNVVHQMSSGAMSIKNPGNVMRGRSQAPTPTGDLGQNLLVQRSIAQVGGGFKPPLHISSQNNGSASKASLMTRTNGMTAVVGAPLNQFTQVKPINTQGSTAPAISSASLANKYIRVTKGLHSDSSKKRLANNQTAQAVSLDRDRQNTINRTTVSSKLNNIVPQNASPQFTPMFAQQQMFQGNNGRNTFVGGLVGEGLTARGSSTANQSPRQSMLKHANSSTKRKDSIDNSPGKSGPLVRSGAASVNPTLTAGVSDKWKARSLANHASLAETNGSETKVSPFIQQLTPRESVLKFVASTSNDTSFMAKAQNLSNDNARQIHHSAMTSQMTLQDNQQYLYSDAQSPDQTNKESHQRTSTISRTNAVSHLFLMPSSNPEALEEPDIDQRGQEMNDEIKLTEILYGQDSNSREPADDLEMPSYGAIVEMSQRSKVTAGKKNFSDQAIDIDVEEHQTSRTSTEQLAKGLAMAKIAGEVAPEQFQRVRAAALAAAPSKNQERKLLQSAKKTSDKFQDTQSKKDKKNETKKKLEKEKSDGTKSRERLGIISPNKKEIAAKQARRRNEKQVKVSSTALSGTQDSAQKPNSTPNTAIKRRPSLNSRKLRRTQQPVGELRSSDKKLVLNGAQLQGPIQQASTQQQQQQPFVVHSGVGGSAGRKIVPSPHLSKFRQSNPNMLGSKFVNSNNELIEMKLQPQQVNHQDTGQTMLINHGDININININPQQLANAGANGQLAQISTTDRKLSALSKEELSQLIYQNILLQQQEQAAEALRQRQQPRQASVVTATTQLNQNAPAGYQNQKLKKQQQVDRFVLWQNLMQQYQNGTQALSQQTTSAFGFEPVPPNQPVNLQQQQQQLLQAQAHLVQQQRVLQGLDVKGRTISQSQNTSHQGARASQSGVTGSNGSYQAQPRVALATVVHNQPEQLRMTDGTISPQNKRTSPSHHNRSPQHEQNYGQQQYQQQRVDCDLCNHHGRPTVDLVQLFDQSHFLHLVDQYGNHSQYCRCFRIAAQLQAQQQIQLDETMIAQNLLPILQQNLLAAQLGVKDFSQLSAAQQQRLHMSYLQQVVIQQKQAAMAQYASPKQYRKRNAQPATASSANNNNQQVTMPSVTRMETINGFIKKLNQLIQITLKATDSINPLQLNQIKKLGNEIGIKWTSYLDAKFIKSKDFVTFLKSKVYVLFNALLMRNSGISLFNQVEMMSASTSTKEKKKRENAEGKEQSASKHQHVASMGTDSEGNPFIVGNTIDQKKLQQTQIGQIMANNSAWLNQIQVYNLLKFKNSGFKFWVECPTTYGNNFIVVRSVCKRRTWLTWVDHDPYEERQEPAPQPIMMPEPAKTKEKSEEKRGGAARRLTSKKVQDEGNSSSNDSGDEGNNHGSSLGFSYHNRQFANAKIHPNVLFTQIKRIKIVKELMPHQIYNHIDGINQIAAKCQLHRNMKAYAQDVLNDDPWTVMPETYIVELPAEKCSAKYVFEHEEYLEFAKAFTKGSWWIIKPGEDANRGHGIKVLNDITRIRQCISHEFISGPKQYRTCIIQRYIERPFLVHRRKFDIRVFALLTYVANFERKEGTMRGWFYEEGYIRTSCKEFSLAAGDNPYIHLTNDAVQKQSQDYGRFEAGNKISYSDFDKLLTRERDVSFYNKLLPQIKNRVADVFKAGGKKMIGEVRSDYNGFEWLGLDFMIDDDMNLTLIEVNTNPCLETQSCILLQRLIPQMLDQSMKIAVDPFFGASEHQYLMNHEFVATEFKYSMVYEETIKNIRSTPTWDGDYLYGPSAFYANKMQSAIEKEAQDFANGGYAAMEGVELGTVAAHSEDESGGGGAATMGQKDSDEDDDLDDDDE